jgi:hypothetical protein
MIYGNQFRMLKVGDCDDRRNIDIRPCHDRRVLGAEFRLIGMKVIRLRSSAPYGAGGES